MWNRCERKIFNNDIDKMMFKKIFKKKPKPVDYSLIEEIIVNFSEREEVRKLVVPNSIVDDYLLIDEGNQIYIHIKNGRVHITNHKYYVNKELPLKETENLKSIIRNRLENEREAMISQIFKNEMELLTKIKEL